MKKVIAAAMWALLASANAGTGFLNGSGTALSGDGSEGNAYDMGAIGAAPTLLAVTIPGVSGTSFEEYANFTIPTLSDVSGAANTYQLSLGNLNIDNLTVEVWDGVHPFGGTNFLTFSGNNVVNFIGTLDPGQYHLDISGTFSGDARQGQYSVALVAAPVPEPQTYALMLGGLGVLAFVTRRRRNEQN